MKFGLIYKATNIVTGKSYIGKTLSSLQKRKNQHIRSAIGENKRHYKFYNVLRKYGVENFKWEILKDNICEEDLNLHETWFILTYDTKINGYNSTYGGMEEINLAKGRFRKNKTPWNKGLKYTKQKVKRMALKAKETRKRNDPNHISAPRNKNLTKEALFDCVVVKKLTREQTALSLNVSWGVIKKWKQIWRIMSPDNGQLKRGGKVGINTRFHKGLIPWNKK